MALRLVVFASFLASSLAAVGPYHVLRIPPQNFFAPYEAFPPFSEPSYRPEEKSYLAPSYPEKLPNYAPPQTEEEPYHAPAPYKFKYDVSNSHSHSESGSGGKVDGSYSVIEPDGQKRTVKYSADAETGFKAEVTREPASIYPKEKPYSAPTYSNEFPYTAPNYLREIPIPYTVPTYLNEIPYTFPKENPYSAPTEPAEKSEVPSPYHFKYEVSNSHSHSESRQGDKVEGSYSVVEPDGQKRTVKYTADDKTGFKAEVSREPADNKFSEVPKETFSTPEAKIPHLLPVTKTLNLPDPLYSSYPLPNSYSYLPTQYSYPNLGPAFLSSVDLYSKSTIPFK